MLVVLIGDSDWKGAQGAPGVLVIMLVMLVMWMVMWFYSVKILQIMIGALFCRYVIISLRKCT